MSQVSKVLDQLTRSVEAIRQLKGCKEIKGVPGGLKVYECRINAGYRLSFILVPGGVPYLLTVGHHDHLVKDTKRLVEAGVEVPTDGPPTVDLPARSTPPSDPRARRDFSPTVESPLHGVSDELLFQMTVPRTLLSAVRGLSDANQILGISGLPPTACEALLSYFVDGIIAIPGVCEDLSATEVAIQVVQEARQKEQAMANLPPSALGFSPEFLLEIGVPENQVAPLLSATTWEAIEETPLPMKVAKRLMEAVAARDVTGMSPGIEPDRVVASVDELQRYYTGELTDLLLHLTEEQRPILDLRTDQLHLLKGVAGSGKTTVALYRARRVIAESAHARALVVTYTKALAATAGELVAAITTPAERDRIEVTHLHQWMASYQGKRRPTVTSNVKRLDLIQRILEQLQAEGATKSRILSRAPSWFIAEISESIKGRGLQTLPQYLALDRSGRETALPEAARRAVWQVFERYQAGLEGRADWDDLPIQCLRQLEADPQRPRYDFVVVDEAQDLSPMSLRLVAALAHEGRPAGMVVADAAQSIYRRGFRWKDTGLAVHGSKVHKLTNNHRNTMQILAAANALLEGRPELRDDGDGAVADLNAPRLGPKPRILLRKSFQEEAKAVVEDIQLLRRRKGLRYGNVAILVPTKNRMGPMAWALGKARIPVTQQGDPSFALRTEAVKILTMHSAKGLEFPVVYVCDCTAGTLPRIAAEPEEQQEAEDVGRKLLYVAMTRAMHELVLTGSASTPSQFLDEFPENLVQLVTRTPTKPAVA